jgi:dihydrofolate synthase/folylpolyglutamate synthase
VQKEGFKPGAYKPGLEGMIGFDEALGHPSRGFRSIHMAGTNGKGSVANMLAAALTAAGYRTGLYTSPHLVDFRERARINGTMIPREYVQAFLEKWKPYFEAENLSFFEITTGMAFRWFADQQVDVAVIEAGLGGRLDSTNLITPELSIITSIGLDHCALLGNTLAEIAAEKAGIIKPGVPCVIGESNPATDPVFDAKADGFCPLIYADRIEPRLWDRHEAILAAMDLQAPIQRKNLRTVLAALDILSEDSFGGLRPPQNDKEGPERSERILDGERIIYGIEHTAEMMEFHGRWERLKDKPLVIADIGHNAHALESNFKALEAMNRPLIIVYGIMADKDLGAIIPLMPRKARYIFVAPDTPRAMPAEEIQRRCGFGITAPSVKAGMEIAMKEAAQDTVIYVGGSTFVVAEVL